MRKFIILLCALVASINISAQTKEKQDSLNIPVFLVDGVEVQNIDNLDQKDIISVNVIKNGDFNKLFYPRTGGVMLITKKYLKPIIQKYQENMKKAKSGKKPGQVYIR